MDISPRLGWALGCVHGVVDGARWAEPSAQRAHSESRALGTSGNVVGRRDYVQLASVASAIIVRESRVAGGYVPRWASLSQKKCHRPQFLALIYAFNVWLVLTSAIEWVDG